MRKLEVPMLRFGSLLPALVLLAGCVGSSVGSSLAGFEPSTIHNLPLASGTHCPQYAKGSGLLSDGDFHQAKNPGANYLTFSKGQSLAPSWKVTKLNINFVGTMFWSFDGLCSVDLDGQSAVGGIAHHSFVTKKGALYTVSFLMSGNSYCAATVKKMKVVAGNKSVLFKWDTAGGHSVQYGKFAHRHFQFTATAPATTLVFDSLDQAGSGCGPVIGAIAVTKS
jgi:choice-of-anchor C domain-containing protein